MWPHRDAYEGLVDRREKLGARLSIRDPFGALASMIVMLVVLTFATQRHPAVIAVVAVAFASGALVPALQTRLLDVGRCAASLAGALNPSALNIGNALGAALGGGGDRRGRRTCWVGAALAAGGLAAATRAVSLDRPDRARPEASRSVGMLPSAASRPAG
jgi:MFS transporter, DHA1 family, inner membrane transport protein